MKMDSEFRQDIVSGEWILVAGGIKKKPNFFVAKKPKASKKNCPFETSGKINNETPLYWVPRVKVNEGEKKKLSSWFLQVVPNKFPVLRPHKMCPVPASSGPYMKMAGVGFQEVVITRDHDKSLGQLKNEEVESVIDAYISRYLSLKKEKCVAYILIFHNHGPSAGATVGHPHSQIIALPIIPLDVSRSLKGSEKYFVKHGKCAHCEVLKKEFRDNKRIIIKNKDFVAISPFASHFSFETRIYPIKHRAKFEEINDSEKKNLAQILRQTLAKVRKAMNDTNFNFFIHTAPVKSENFLHYHWHLEILPRTNIWAGLELGSGTEVVKIPPEEAAKILRSEKV